MLGGSHPQLFQWVQVGGLGFAGADLRRPLSLADLPGNLFPVLFNLSPPLLIHHHQRRIRIPRRVVEGDHFSREYNVGQSLRHPAHRRHHPPVRGHRICSRDRIPEGQKPALVNVKRTGYVSRSVVRRYAGG